MMHLAQAILQPGHLGTGSNAPKIISAEMDAAVVCTLAVCSNAPLSVAASTPPFARPYEQTGHY